MAAYTLTFDRAVATVAAIAALIALIAGVLALIRGRDPRVALIAGALTLPVGVWVLATADGGPGTGNGVVGGYASVAFGLTAVILGGLARTRSRSERREHHAEEQRQGDRPDQ
ncbi:DUF6223 family protein [Actinoplanes sichuanensis]|uniref:DUF6223 family protein n=1 Tax=Actinoplanes sichuanensis TaxID=512349 RepID=A0ABW4A8H2_9ACTN|nr:DUF6223 family protein [Actinoplanes sichuanensis]BEL06549.1 DUF6223 family protein [Actinoplanes sichuanensis]